MLEDKVERRFFREAYLDRSLERRQFQADWEVQRHMRQGKLFPLGFVTHMQHRAGYYRGQ